MFVKCLEKRLWVRQRLTTGIWQRQLIRYPTININPQLLVRKAKWTLMITTINLHIPCCVWVLTSKLLNKVPELRGTSLNLHGACYVHNFDTLFASLCLPFALHLIDTKYIHSSKMVCGSECRNWLRVYYYYYQS